MYESRSYIAVPPGETIKEQLENRRMTQKEFAERMGLTQKHVSQLINGEVQLTQNVANKLNYVLGLPASFWNRLESTYREQLELAKTENEMDNDKTIASQLPYADCASLGWFPKTRSKTEKVHNLRRFFKVTSLAAILKSKSVNIAFRKLTDNISADGPSLMWVQRIKNASEDIQAGDINISKLKEMVPEIRLMTNEDPSDFYERLVDMLASCGIKLVLEKSPKGSFLHGATFLFRKSIILGITDRGKDADRFWFSLFHEIGHILLGHIDNDQITDEDEKEADLFARDILVPSESYNDFVNNKEIKKVSVITFADSIDISPGIVVGRLQTDGYLKFNQLNELKSKYTIVK